MSGDDDFIMTINDGDTVPDLEDEHSSATESQPNPSKRKDNSKSSKKTKKQKSDSDSDKDMSSEFMIELDTDGLDSVPQTLDFTLARASLKRRNNTVTYSTLDEKIAVARKENKIARKVKRVKESLERLNQKTDSEADSEAEENADSDDSEGSGGDVFVDAVSDIKEHGSEMSENDGEGESEESEDSENSEDSEDSENSESESEESESSSEVSDDSESEEDEVQEARKRAYFAPESDTPSETPDTFTTMNISRPILKGLAKLGFNQPTPIQARTIPVALLGKDICGGAQTGSGKTAAFLIPILERLLYRPKNTALTRVLILCPTRELAIQCHNVGTKLAAFTDITQCLCVGGLSLKLQESELRLKPDIVIATPGRLIDHLRNSATFNVDQIEILVMDEADRMLEDGFEDELSEIIKACPRNRQTMLFSATMTDNVDKLVRLSLHKPVRAQIDPPKAAAQNLTQEFVRVRSNQDTDRTAILVSLCKRHFKHQCIIFFRSKAAAHQMKIVFGLLGMRAGELHGNLAQEARLEALEAFRDRHVDFLMATDLAARGLDIKGVQTVINYTMPAQLAQYLHRVGRTARAGRSGRAVTLVGESDRKMLKLAVKHSTRKDKIKQRVVPASTMKKYRERVEEVTEKVGEILEEEKREKILNEAEMQVTRASNILKYKKDIESRPRRTWFQSNDDRKAAKKASERSYSGKK